MTAPDKDAVIRELVRALEEFPDFGGEPKTALGRAIREWQAKRDAALALAKSVLDGGGWRAIDTVPPEYHKDGTEFLAYIKHGSQWHRVIAAFGASGVLYDMANDSSVAWDPTGRNGRLRENWPMWQPLPAPPADQTVKM